MSARTPSTNETKLPLERLRPRLLERIRLMMGQEARTFADSDDFFQGLCVEALRDRAQLPSDPDDRTLLRWLTAIARNNIRDEVRRRRERTFDSFSATLGLAGGATPPSHAALREERRDRLAEALEGLPPDHRTVIELRDLEELSFRAVGERMDRSEEAARKLYTRALVNLGRAVGQD